MYKGQASWLSDTNGIYSAGIEQTLTRSLRNKILAEATLTIDGNGERAVAVQDAFNKLQQNINTKLERA